VRVKTLLPWLACAAIAAGDAPLPSINTAAVDG